MKSKKSAVIISAITVLALVIGVILGMYLSGRSIFGQSDTSTSGNRMAEDVSMIQLIANPEKYDGKLVRVIGVGNIEFEGNYISLSKEDWKYHAYNSLWIDLKGITYEEAAKHNGEYVIVEGIFDKDNRGHLSAFHGAIVDITRYELWDSYPSNCVSISQESDHTYSYSVTSLKGRVLVSEEGLSKHPDVEQIGTDVVGVHVQAGTGLSTRRSLYCDLENSRTSEIFYYVLAAQDNYVVYANFEDGKHSIVVQNIFDKSEYYKAHELENVSSVAADFTVDHKLNEDGTVTVTYLTGDSLTETDITIQLP